MSAKMTGLVNGSTLIKVSASSLLTMALKTCSHTSLLSRTMVANPLDEGQKVSFTIESGAKGPAAGNVVSL